MALILCPQCKALGKYKVNGVWVNCERCGGTPTQKGSGAIDDGLPLPSMPFSVTPSDPPQRWHTLMLVGASMGTLIAFTVTALLVMQVFHIMIGANAAVGSTATVTPLVITATPTCPPPPPPDAPPGPPPGPMPGPNCPRPPTPTLPVTPNGTITTGPYLEVNPANFIHSYCNYIHDVLFLRNGVAIPEMRDIFPAPDLLG